MYTWSQSQEERYGCVTGCPKQTALARWPPGLPPWSIFLISSLIAQVRSMWQASQRANKTLTWPPGSSWAYMGLSHWSNALEPRWTPPVVFTELSPNLDRPPLIKSTWKTPSCFHRCHPDCLQCYGWGGTLSLSVNSQPSGRTLRPKLMGILKPCLPRSLRGLRCQMHDKPKSEHGFWVNSSGSFPQCSLNVECGGTGLIPNINIPGNHGVPCQRLPVRKHIQKTCWSYNPQEVLIDSNLLELYISIYITQYIP